MAKSSKEWVFRFEAMRFFSLVLLCFLLVGCDNIHIPAPTVPPDGPLPPVADSSVSVPVTINLDPLLQQLESAVPPGQTCAGAWNDLGRSYAGSEAFEEHNVWRSPLSFNASGNTLTLSTTISYWFKIALRVRNGGFFGGYSFHDLGSCGVGEPPRQAIITIRSTVGLSSDYHLVTHTTVDPINFLNRDLVTIAKIDVTPIVNNVFQGLLGNVASTIDSKVPRLTNIQPPCNKGWTTIQNPIAAAAGTWLLINPKTITAAALNGSGHSITQSVTLTAEPQIIVAGTAPAATTVPFPPLGQGSPGNQFHIAVEGTVGFDEAAKQLGDKIDGREYPIDGHTIKIEKVSIYGTGKLVVVEVGVSGAISGTIYLDGTPAYNAATGALSITNFDFSLETKNILANAANWLLHSQFKDSIQSELSWNVTGQITTAKTDLQAALNRQIAPGTVLHGTVADLTPLGIYSTADSFKVRASADGTLSLSVTP